MKSVKQIKKIHGLFVALCVLGTMGVFYTGNAAVSTVQSSLTTTGGVRDASLGAKDVSGGVTIMPADSKDIVTGPANRTFLKLRGINTPSWVNQNGPLQVVSDLKVHGMSDFRNGLVNNGPDARINATLTSSPAALPVTVSAASVSLGRFALKPSFNATVTKLSFKITGTTPTMSFNNGASSPIVTSMGVVNGVFSTVQAGVMTFTPSTPLNATAGASIPLELFAVMNNNSVLNTNFTVSLSDITAKSVATNGVLVSVDTPLTIRQVNIQTPPTVTVANLNAAYSAIPVYQNTAQTTVAQFKFSTGSGIATLNTINLSVVGTMPNIETNITNLTLYDANNNALSTPSAITRSGSNYTAIITPTISPTIATTSTTLTLKADVKISSAYGNAAATYGTWFYFRVASMSANPASLTYSNAFPVNGTQMFASTPGLTVTNRTTNPYGFSIPSTVFPNETGTGIAMFDFKVTGGPLTMSSITLWYPEGASPTFVIDPASFYVSSPWGGGPLNKTTTLRITNSCGASCNFGSRQGYVFGFSSPITLAAGTTTTFLLSSTVASNANVGSQFAIKFSNVNSTPQLVTTEATAGTITVAPALYTNIGVSPSTMTTNRTSAGVTIGTLKFYGDNVALTSVALSLSGSGATWSNIKLYNGPVDLGASVVETAVGSARTYKLTFPTQNITGSSSTPLFLTAKGDVTAPSATTYRATIQNSTDITATARYNLTLPAYIYTGALPIPLNTINLQ